MNETDVIRQEMDHLENMDYGVATADNFPSCEPCQDWREAGAWWPRPCARHYEGEPLVSRRTATLARERGQGWRPLDDLRPLVEVDVLEPDL